MDVRTSVIGGLVLGGLVLTWQIVAVALALNAAFPLVATLIELVVLIAVLARTRAEQTYSQQLGAGLIATGVSLGPIALGFVLAVFVLFPDAIAQQQATVRATMEAAGSTPDEIEATMAMLTPISQGLAGVIGTAVTGLVVSALAAIGLRKRG